MPPVLLPLLLLRRRRRRRWRFDFVQGCRARLTVPAQFLDLGEATAAAR